MAVLEELLSYSALDKLVKAHSVPGRAVLEAVRNAASAPEDHRTFLDALGYRIAAGLMGAIGILDPEMVEIVAGDVGRAGGFNLMQHVRAVLAKLPIALPQIVPAAVSDNPVRAGAVELALERTRERVFTGGAPHAPPRDETGLQNRCNPFPETDMHIPRTPMKPKSSLRSPFRRRLRRNLTSLFASALLLGAVAELVVAQEIRRSRNW